MSKLILLLAIVFSASAFAQMDPVSSFDKMLYTSGNNTLPYRLLQPVRTPEKKMFPLVIFLHGAGERGNDNEIHLKHIEELFLNQNNRNRFPCYVLAPQCPERIMWASHDQDGNRLVMKENPTQIMAMVISLIAKIEKDFPIDRSRIYITGVSMGGYGTWDLLARFPDRFAAAIPICGGGDPKTAASFKHVPIWAFHGALDPIVRPRQSRIMIKALLDAGGHPGYTEYPDVKHDSWVNAYREPQLLQWLFNQQSGKKTKL